LDATLAKIIWVGLGPCLEVASTLFGETLACLGKLPASSCRAPGIKNLAPGHLYGGYNHQAKQSYPFPSSFSPSSFPQATTPWGGGRGTGNSVIIAKQLRGEVQTLDFLRLVLSNWRQAAPPGKNSQGSNQAKSKQPPSSANPGNVGQGCIQTAPKGLDCCLVRQ
jgi:hypothetical protein